MLYVQTVRDDLFVCNAVLWNEEELCLVPAAVHQENLLALIYSGFCSAGMDGCI